MMCLAVATGAERSSDIRENYRRRRDALVEGLNRAGWPVALLKATMVVWRRFLSPSIFYLCANLFDFLKE
jgi:alanine-synthesizing transaminase